MKALHLVIIIGAIILSSCGSSKKEVTKPTKLPYPPTQMTDHKDTYFDTTIVDPYHWLEDDNAPETGQWVDAQNKVTFDYLKNIPFRDKFRTRLAELFNYDAFASPISWDDTYIMPQQIGPNKNYIYFKKSGLENQAKLYLQDTAGNEQVLIDQNNFSNTGSDAISGLFPSPDGKFLAYKLSRSGSDWNNVFVFDVEQRKVLSDTIQGVKFSRVAWHNNGFFYSRYPLLEKSDALTGVNKNNAVYYHVLGTNQSEDKLIYERKDQPDWAFDAVVSADKKHLILLTKQSTYGHQILVKSLDEEGSNFVALNKDFKNEYALVYADGGKVWAHTDHNAPNFKLAVCSFSSQNWADVIPESEHKLEQVKFGGGKFFANYLVQAKSEIKQYNLNGKLERNIELPGIGEVRGFNGPKDTQEVFYSFNSLITPGTVYKYDINSGRSDVYFKPKLNFEPDDFIMKQVFYKSFDGTPVSMFILHKKGITMNGKIPTFLYGYGGFSISLTPRFSPRWIAWADQGGIFAMPNLRGGGEYGAKWHQSGTKLNKKNVFKDFIAAGEYLIKQNYTSKEYLAIHGRSNGGLLVGATMTLKPDFCQVAIPTVGVMDMLRFQEFTIGRYWAADYGASDESKEMFEYLLSYSPIHSIKNVHYPATLVTTADHDDRVVPAHSFKFIATLQEKNTSTNPTLIRIDKEAGHGAGYATDKYIDIYTDIYSFCWANMNYTPPVYESNN